MSKPQDTPRRSQYLKVYPPTKRYRLLIALADELGCTWQEVARFAIDEYLRKNPPKQQVYQNH